MTTEPHSPERDTLRQRLYQLLDDTELPLAAKQRQALEVGCEYLGLTRGHIRSRAADDVFVSVGEGSGRNDEKQVVDRVRTYCRRAETADSVVALPNTGEHGGADGDHGVGCYLGTAVFVGGEIDGTICFTSETPRERAFTPDEKAFVELIARLIGRAAEAAADEGDADSRSQSRRRSAAKYEALLQLVPDAVLVVDADTGSIETVNEQTVRLTGYAAADLRGMSVLDLHPEDDRERYARLLEADFDERVRDRFDDGTTLTLKRADGTELPIELGLSRVDLGDRIVVLGVLRDISDRRERDRELSRRRELFQQTQEAVSLGGWVLDLDSMTGEWTDEIYRIFELPLGSEVTVTDAFEYFYPEDRQRITDAFEQLTAEGEPYDLELRLRTAEGTDRWVRTLGRPRYDGTETDDGQPTGAIGIIWEISDRKEREQDLRVKDQAIEAAMVGITISDAADPELPIMYANTGFEEMTGYSKAEAMGRNCRFLQGPGTDDDTVDEIRRAIEAEEPIQTEILNYRANGTPFWNELTISPVMGADSSETTHFVGVQNDVTAQKRRERLIELLDRVLRHNLRNDMNVIMGFSDAIATRTDDEVARMATRMKSTAAELISLTDKIRGFETGVTEAKSLDERTVREDIRSVVEDLRVSHPDTTFSVEAGGEETVLATEQLKLALSELGENAATYGAGTPVCYAVTTTAEGKVAIHVRDGGPGLPPTERRVLESGRETPLEHGSGLGLWMVNWIVTGLGGSVTATNEDGTTVTITLPPAAETDPGDRRTSAFSDTTEQGPREN